MGEGRTVALGLQRLARYRAPFAQRRPSAPTLSAPSLRNGLFVCCSPARGKLFGASPSEDGIEPPTRGFSILISRGRLMLGRSGFPSSTTIYGRVLAEAHVAAARQCALLDPNDGDPARQHSRLRRAFCSSPSSGPRTLVPRLFPIPPRLVLRSLKRAFYRRFFERETGFEPATPSLGSLCSTN